jgi:replicative DNA helicase
MESCARRAIRDWDRKGITPGAIIVDHLTIARADQDRKGNKVAEVGDISRSLAEMAKRLDVPVVALCQLSRQVEARTNADKRPSLSDLRWSGEIEQDARLVMFLYRPEYYCRRPEDESDHEAMMEWKTKLDKVRRRLWWLVEKNNNGPTGEVETHCDIACSAIRDRRGVQ